MIHAALWILSALIVIPVVALVASGSLYLLLGNGRWRYTLGIGVLLIAGFGVLLSEQNKAANEAAAARYERNQPLQRQCVEKAEANAYRLRSEAVARGTYTENYSQRLVTALTHVTNNCKFKYPTY